MQTTHIPAVISATRLFAAAVAATAATVALISIHQLFDTFEERMIWRTLAAVTVVALVFAFDGLASARGSSVPTNEVRTRASAAVHAGRQAGQTHDASRSGHGYGATVSH